MTEIRTQISQVGKITDRAKHLGITITPDYNLTRDYTYADIYDKEGLRTLCIQMWGGET